MTAAIHAVSATLIAASASLAARAAESWQPLFRDAGSFAGFQQLGGKAAYSIDAGTVTGTSVPGTPNSFMATEKEYGDFVLEYEFKVDEALNSGVQIRSHSRQDYKKGVVHGYQCEIDPSARAWSAGIYEESRRGWLCDLKNNPQAGAAFKHGAWNRVRIEALGDSIKTWLNGVPAADLRDAQEQAGFIALQVHGVGSDAKKAGLTVQWRGLRIDDRGRHVWKPLFDGKSLAGWAPSPGGTWTVEDGAIHGVSPASDPRHGLLLAEAPQGDFTIKFQFKAAKGNSGFYFRSEPVPGSVSVHGFQAEVCTDDETGGLYETGGRGWVAQTDNALMKDKKVRRDGGWNEMWVSAHGSRLVVHVNGVKTADITDTKQTRASGRLGFQLHGGQDMDVWFKDVALLVPVQ